ncbi:synaptophysin-like protein 1 isoform X2 [Lynx canadensis]|uniref:synaptophysin-like protein 1 isoform X2 n=2 Tax=Lynx TaxID=13124 RepID=UPI001659E91A|nr:synaptophysin-like protein 1 isoform X2 [Lynx canadensis]XP_040328851.1 synaptophysin-like protein 1 isoform X2 [Puma yagouaroundi]
MASNIYLVRQRISRLGQRMSSFQLNLNPLKEPLGFIKVLEWDFVVTLVATFLWLVSTSAWAKALTDIKIATGPGIVKELQPCNHQVTCYFGSVTSMGSLNVSVIFGFLNMILWGGNAWFVYKETSLHSPSNTSASHSQGGIPPPSGI